MRRSGTWLLTIGASLALTPLPAAGAGCAMSRADKAWLDGAIANWRASERDILKLMPAPLPTIIAIDAACTYTGKADRQGRLRWTAAAHGDPVALPGGNSAPIGPISFASPDNGAAGTGYFAMSLPSVWRKAGVTSELGLERLMDGVMLHELMHTRQFYFANPRLAALTRDHGLPDDIGDDSLQDAFKADAGYVAAYEAERDLLYAAATAATDGEARVLAGKALAKMRARRAGYFTGANAKWQPLDDLFLTMEGLGQWLAYAWYVKSGVPAPAAIEAVRRKRNFWSQDEGLALFLTIDRLVPGWQRDAFAEQPLLGEALLAKAAG
ncbi:hypothetical protein [Sphingomonas colocasiae]|uniref:Uncharacterized protein n=1 Tax=Sphingomonas colocasiae TaxID=1848973 RepID=A0ABS7PYY1_9SPHN|nr:hypothetical protein [Sphingomonas colocasiae]MBY8825194.1 hypothetical protein [Sphingomonas colocasiae]